VGANHHHDEQLGHERLDEPSGLELCFGGAENDQQCAEGEVVEDRTDQAEGDHESADEVMVEATGQAHLFGIDAIGGDGERG
jgi:hypothetical protein